MISRELSIGLYALLLWRLDRSVELTIYLSHVMTTLTMRAELRGVNLDHFDPEAVRELSRTLSRCSAHARPKTGRSDVTLTPEPFLLEKTLGIVLGKFRQIGLTPSGFISQC